MKLSDEIIDFIKLKTKHMFSDGMAKIACEDLMEDCFEETLSHPTRYGLIEIEKVKPLATVGKRILDGLNEKIKTVPGSIPHEQLKRALAQYESAIKQSNEGE